MRRLFDKLVDAGNVRVAGAPLQVPFEPSEDTQVVVADGVADYFYQGTDQEYWYLEQDFPNVAPPWPDFFVEYRAPNRIVSSVKGTRKWEGASMIGTHFRAEEVDDDPENPERRWRVAIAMWQELDRELLMMPWLTYMGVRDDGSIGPSPPDVRAELAPNLEDGEPPPDLRFVPAGVDPRLWDHLSTPEPDGQSRLQHLAPSLLYVAFLTLSFLHCKNVTVERTGPPAALRKKHAKRGRSSTDFHVLHIEPMTQVVAATEREHGVGTVRALHIRRGEFRDYRQRGLFGRHKGVFWFDQHWRGSSAHGQADKRYEVEAPDGE